MKQIFLAISILSFFAACSSGEEKELKTTQEEKKSDKKSDPLADAHEITGKIGGALVSTLTQKIDELGAAGAIEYCNIHALPITDSIAKANGAYVKRTSFNIRNPKNEPTYFEKQVLARWESEMITNKKPQAYSEVNDDGTVSSYIPIFMGELCLKCHGEPGVDIDEATLDAIEAKYPEDLAINLEKGRLRGMWKITKSY